MKLFKIQGNWSGSAHPTITNIKLKSTGQYEYENAEFEVYNQEGINRFDPPVFNDSNHRWKFIVPNEGIPTSTYQQYHGTLDTRGMRVIVTYTLESGVSNTCEAQLTVSDAVYPKVRYVAGHSGSKYQIYQYSEHAALIYLEANLTSDPDFTPRVGSRLLAYAVCDSYDESTDTYSPSVIIKNEIDLDPHRNTDKDISQYIEIPDTVGRATIYTLSYNINEADVLVDVLPANDDEVRDKVRSWNSSDTKYLKVISGNEFDTIWGSIKYPNNPINPYRIGVATECWKTFAAMANITGPSYAYSDEETTYLYDKEAWDSSTLLKVFSGPNCIAAIKTDNSVITMGYNNGELRTSIESTPFPANLEKIAIGYTHAVGLLSNGTVVHRGSFYSDTWQNGANSWTGIVDVIAGDDWTVGVKSDGSLVSVANVNCNPIVDGQFTGVIVKKVYLIDRYYFATIDDVGKVRISGNTGRRQVIDDMKTAVASWPDMMCHLVSDKYRIYGFCNHPSYEKQVWCTDTYGQAAVDGWQHIVAATIYANGLLAIRCDGQILSSSSSALSVIKESNNPVSWSADRITVV